MVLAAAGALAGQQRPVSRDSQPIPLTTTDRIDLVNSVLVERASVMDGKMLVEACALAKALQVTGDVSDMLSSQFQATLRGRQDSQCRDYDVPAGFVRVSFDTMRYERRQRVGGSHDVVVVSLYAFSPGGRINHEEWAMSKARPGVWQAGTVKIAFWWH